jgi:hypothetical protein
MGRWFPDHDNHDVDPTVCIRCKLLQHVWNVGVETYFIVSLASSLKLLWQF